MNSDTPPRSVKPELPELPVLPAVLAEEEEALEESPRVVLITGAAGNLGTKLRRHWQDRYEVMALDRHEDPDDPDLILADLTEWDENWTALLDEVDVVVHLAANPDPSATWPELVGPNVEGLANLLLACAQAGVERVVFASSCHVFDGDSWPEKPDSPVRNPHRPSAGSPYGASKLAGERLGRSFALAAGLSFVALRFGWVQAGENLYQTIADHPHRGLWLSNDDFLQVVTLAVETDLPEGTFLSLLAVSDNPGSPWSWQDAARELGYQPGKG